MLASSSDTRMLRRRGVDRIWFASWLLSAAASLTACQTGDEEHPLDELRQPTGLAISPGGSKLFVSNGDWDRAYATGTLVVMDLDALDEGLTNPKGAGATLSEARPCRMADDEIRVECDPRLLIDEANTVRIPGGPGNIGVDRPGGDDGPLRLIIPTRHRSALTWIDVTGADGGSLDVECGQDESRACGPNYTLDDLDSEPSRIHVDSEGFRFAYVPHLLGLRLTIIDLDGDDGPEIADVDDEFYREDDLFDSGLGGGFAVAQLPCDLENGPVHAATLECARPYLYTTHRFWPGVKTFRVAPGLGALLTGSSYYTGGSNIEAAEPGPLTGDLQFVDPNTADELLVVHTTPPSLARFETTIGEDGGAANQRLGSIPVCNNPNLLAIHRPEDHPWLAFVSCYGADEVVAVSLAQFEIVATMHLGDGPNEMLVDADREVLYVANTIEGSISLIDLDAMSPSYLREFAVLGLATERETP